MSSPSTASIAASRLTEAALGYQQALIADPRHPQALVGMSLIALASRQPHAAVEMATAAVGVAPSMTTAWIALGQAFKSTGAFDQAECAYLHALSLDGTNALACLGLGELRVETGHPQEAIADFELALLRNPTMVSAHFGLGNALAALDRNDEALDRYTQALALHPHLPEAEFACGFVLARLGRVKEAETRYRRALVYRPDFAAAWMNLGCLLREQGREAEAEAALRRAVELRPDLVSGWINLAHLERDRRRPAQAEAHLRRAVALNPDQLETRIAWCQFRVAERDFSGAHGWLRWALALNPVHAEAINMHGILLHSEERYAEAVTAFERAEGLGHCAAASNRGNTLLELGRMTDALAAHQAAVARDPTHAGAQYNLALTQLRLGHWEQGWPAYEARWRFRGVHRTPRVFTQPRWDGEPLNGRRILIHAEQGLGDTIQFCRYATMIVARGGFVLLQVQPVVERLVRSLAIVRSGHAEVSTLGAKLSAFDLECPLMSLPGIFATTIETVPWPGAYLSAESMQDGKDPLATRSPRVGLAWAGNPRYKGDARRSMHLRFLAPLLEVAGVSLVSLQKGVATEQLATASAGLRIENASSSDRDLADTAALIATLDVVITTDTCIAHLACAMGKPVWIMLPHLGDWRWMQDVETTPWYPTARLFRQPSRGDWFSVVKRLTEELGIWKLAAFQSPQKLTAASDRSRSSSNALSSAIRPSAWRSKSRL